MKPALTAVAVDRILAYARERAAAFGRGFTIAVVDHTLTLRALLRMDAADTLTVGLAEGKARLVAANGLPTNKWRSAVADDPFLGLTLPTAFDRMVGGAALFGGGYPIRVNGVTIGGIGASGGAESEDDAVARAGIAAIPEAEDFQGPEQA